MTDEIKSGAPSTAEYGETRNRISRREFVSGSTGVLAGVAAIAAGSALGLVSGASPAGAEVSPPEPESPDTSVRFDAPPGDLYNEGRGYTGEDVTGWRGRYRYGVTVGIVLR